MKYPALFVALLIVPFGNSNAIEQQKMTNWCWAAAIQDVVAQAGTYHTQDAIVTRLAGWPQNRPDVPPLLSSSPVSRSNL